MVNSKFIFLVLFVSTFYSCTFKKQIVYIDDIKENYTFRSEKSYTDNIIQSGDVLKVEIYSIIPEASLAYNKPLHNNSSTQNENLFQLDGYLVNKNNEIYLPVLGKIKTFNLTTEELSTVITQVLLKGGHLTNPTVNVRKINSKFTVLGEVNSPGTFNFFDESINLFQAIGYAGGLSIDGKRNKVKLIRTVNDVSTVYYIDLTKSETLKKEIFIIKNNDVLIIEPNFNKIKSAGFIGNPTSIAAISQILLSVTLIILNN